MTAKLTFELTESFEEALSFDEATTGGRYLRVEVSPLIDGCPLLASGGLVFDALSVLVSGATSAELDLYTCSCGVAGCAGIFEDCQCLVTEDSVNWRFPEEPFAKWFAPGMPLEIHFSLPGYVAALARLEGDLEARRAACGAPLLLAPCELVDERDLTEAAVPFHDFLQAKQAQHAEWLSALAEADET